MIRRLLPSPLLTLSLAALWLLLNGAISTGQVLLALLLGVVVPLAVRSLRPTPVRVRLPGALLLLVGRVAFDVLESNWRVLRGTLAPSSSAPAGGFITVPLALRDPNGLAVLAAIMCALPGTIWSEMALDGSELRVHLFELGDPQAEVAIIKSRYERLLMEIFE